MKKTITFLLCGILFSCYSQEVEYHINKYGFSIKVTHEIPTPPIDSTTTWGAFVLTSATYPTLSARLDRAEYLLANTPRIFRYNPTDGDVNHVDDIFARDFLTCLTYNFASTDHHATIPTDTVTYSSHLNSFLSSATHKPEYLTSFNEMFNDNYWTVNAVDACNILDATVREGHKFGCLVGNGGATFPVVYMLLRYYEDNGLTDSVTWFQLHTGLISSHSILGSQSVSRYTYEWNFINAMADKPDFYNVHWYTPERSDTLPTTTDGVFPVLIDFIRKNLGIDVATNEYGSRNHSQVLLNQALTEAYTKHLMFVCYYAGETAGFQAVDNSEYFKQYIESLLAFEINLYKYLGELCQTKKHKSWTI